MRLVSVNMLRRVPARSGASQVRCQPGPVERTSYPGREVQGRGKCAQASSGTTMMRCFNKKACVLPLHQARDCASEICNSANGTCSLM